MMSFALRKIEFWLHAERSNRATPTRKSELVDEVVEDSSKVDMIGG